MQAVEKLIGHLVAGGPYSWVLLVGAAGMLICLLSLLWLLSPPARRFRQARKLARWASRPDAPPPLGTRLAGLVAEQTAAPLLLEVPELGQAESPPSAGAGEAAVGTVRNAPAAGGLLLPPPKEGRPSLLPAPTAKDWPEMVVEVPASAPVRRVFSRRSSKHPTATQHAAAPLEPLNPPTWVQRLVERREGNGEQEGSAAEPAPAEGAVTGADLLPQMVESQLELATLSEEPVEQEEESGLVYDLDLAVLLGEQDEDVARDRPAKEEEPAQKVLAQPAPSEAPALSAGAGEKSPVAAPGGELAEPVETAPLQEQAVPPETTAAQPTETGAAPPAPAAPRMRLNGFGVPTLLVEGSEVAQGQNLGLELLLLLAHSALQKQPSGAEYVSRYTIIDACLPASPQQDARGLASLRTAKYEFLRQVKPQGVAEHELFETGPNNGLRLNPAVSTDLADFMERALLLVQERQAIKAAPEEARAHLRRVKGLLEDLPALYRDGFGRGLSPKRWIADARKHYEGRYRLALTDGAQCLRLLGQTPQAIELATTVLHMEPENVKLVKAVLHWLESQEVGERTRWIASFTASVDELDKSRPLAQRAPQVAQLLFEAQHSR